MSTMIEPMASTIQPMLSEFREEVVITKRVLDRVPGDKLSWKPHAKSMSLGQLAIHIATVPGSLAQITQADQFDASQANFVPTPPKNLEEIHSAFAKSIHDVEEYLGSMTEETAQGSWHLMFGEREIFSRPRAEVLRSIMLNHWYHHRGQLSVYLRMLDIPVPVIYGRSADENPFG
jgi:uncharacterized damage-inducible protein DinB